MASGQYTPFFKGQYANRTHPTFHLHTNGAMFWGDGETAGQFDEYPDVMPTGSSWMVFDWTVIDDDNGGTVEWTSKDVDWTVDIRAGTSMDGSYTLTAAAFLRLLAAAAYGVQLGVAASAPTDGNLAASTAVPYLDQSGDALKIRARWSDGTYHTYTLPASLAGVDTTAWHRDGDTVGVEKYVGTDDNFDLPFRVNNTEKMRLKVAGQLQLATTGATGGVLLGGDALLYRSAADVVATPDDLSILTAGKGLRVAEGSNAKMGTVALVAGTATVSTTAVTANSRIFLTGQADGGTPGFLRVTTITAATSFVITSSSVLDTSTVAWLILDPA